jgi:hypothetical protein
MSAVVHQRCFNHAAREAAARCPECRRFFCRECITEHEDRVLCRECLARPVGAGARNGRSLASVKRVAACGAGILIAWFFFFLIGESLAQVSDSFHEGNVWQIPWIDR